MPDVSEIKDDASRYSIGGNNPPSPIEILRTQLRETYAEMIARFNELIAMEARLPEEMDDDWEAKISEAIKSCTAYVRTSDVTRKQANDPHRALIAATDGFFIGMSDKVDALKTKLSVEFLTPYQQQKAAAEKRRREEEARAAEARRKEEERIRREEAARLAEVRRKEEEAHREAERVDRERREAEARRREEARREIERAEEAKREARRKEQEAREAKDREAVEAAKAEKAKADQEIADAKAKRDREAAEAKEKSDREAQEAAAAIERVKAERKDQERVAAEARDRVAVSTQRANTTSRAAQAKPSDLSRTRTDLGAIASLRTEWKAEVTDAELVPRLYLSVDEGAIAYAVKAATTADGKCPLKIPGVKIYPVTNSVVR